jgi:hypothetical protein
MGPSAIGPCSTHGRSQFTMKQNLKSLTLLALAILIAAPSLGEASGKKKKVRHKPSPVVEKWRAPSYAYAPYRQRHSPNPAWDVYFTDGRYAGSDPDRHVRDMLQRDDPRNIGPN